MNNEDFWVIGLDGFDYDIPDIRGVFTSVDAAYGAAKELMASTGIQPWNHFFVYGPHKLNTILGGVRVEEDVEPTTTDNAHEDGIDPDNPNKITVVLSNENDKIVWQQNGDE